MLLVTGMRGMNTTADDAADDRRQAVGCGPRGGAALAVAALGVVCGVGIYQQAVSGEDQFAASGLVLLLWLGGLVAGVVTWFVLRRVTPVTVIAIVMLVAMLVGFSVWQVRPQAPTGDGYEEGLTRGNDALMADASGALDAVIPGRWKRRFIADPYPCRDWLGRSRGAAKITSYIDVKPHLKLAELRVIGEELQRRGWAVTRIDHDFGTQQGERLEASRNGYDISVDATFDEITVYRDGRLGDDQNEVYVTTPCLRST